LYIPSQTVLVVGLLASALVSFGVYFQVLVEEL